MGDFFDASAPPPGADRPSEQPRVSATADAAERALRELGSEISALVTALEDKEEAEGVDPEYIAAMKALCQADDAPLRYRSIAERVDRGTLTWEQIWVRPYLHGKECVQLVSEALNAEYLRNEELRDERIAEIEERAAEMIRDKEQSRGPDKGPDRGPQRGPGWTP